MRVSGEQLSFGGRRQVGATRKAAQTLVRELQASGREVDPVLKASLYVAADEVDRARRAGDAPGTVAYVNRDLRDAHRALMEAVGGGEPADPFADINDALRAAALGN